MSDASESLHAICVCSDAKASSKFSNDDLNDELASDLALPASTNPEKIGWQIKNYRAQGGRTVIFSTYQSIEAVHAAAEACDAEFSLVICDEAHRTTGVGLKGKEKSNFLKIHDNEYIKAKYRLYMTATPRLYRESAKAKAQEKDYILASMDDEDLYGKEIMRLGFAEAVNQGLLCDYKVLVLTVSENDVPEAVKNQIRDNYLAKPKDERPSELNFDDATKLIGCINGLSKRLKGDDHVTLDEDPSLMQRAVMFCQTINPTASNPNFSSKQIAAGFEKVCDKYRQTLSPVDQSSVVRVKAEHDGSMNAFDRSEKIRWLQEDIPDGECRVLCNVRCLSEGVDVPALDAVVFVSPRNSEVEVVQSVGRVMRSFMSKDGAKKKYGYIIIPVIVPDDISPEEALNDNERFKVVWTILNALRSHDENFNAHVNKISLNKKKPSKIVVVGVPKPAPGTGTYTTSKPESEPKGTVIDGGSDLISKLDAMFGTLQGGIYARLVEKVGDKLYWENWAKKVGFIAQKFIKRITDMISVNADARKSFSEYLDGLRRNINPSVSESQAVEMLAQHMITVPVFDALFSGSKFIEKNAVSKSMHGMLELLKKEGFEMDTEELNSFYASVRNNVGGIDNLAGRQTIIKNLYEKFFKGAFQKATEQFGIVYTPMECADFIIRSVDDILKKEFGTSLSADNVHILDPFTGTGTFITRLLQSGLIHTEDLKRKYLSEIHCNEIVLLAYYVASVNIENVFHEIAQRKDYLPYDGICLTDTFQLNENGNGDIFSELFQENSERVSKQKKAPIRIILGNPPYSAGKKSANNNIKKIRYPHLEERIKDTYAEASEAGLKKAVYDSYIKAFRWASDRIEANKDGGIVAFITNSGWLDRNATAGMRKAFEEEFSSIYVFNLRGNQKSTSGEESRREGGKIFGNGSRASIAITILVRNPSKLGIKAKIYYHDIGDYLTRDQKLRIIKDFGSVANMRWDILHPNDKFDWINQRGNLFDQLISLPCSETAQSFFSIHSLGVGTGRDKWCYNSSNLELENKIKATIYFYNTQVDNYILQKNISNKSPREIIKIDPTKFYWRDEQINQDLPRGIHYEFQKNLIKPSLYRPFFRQYIYFSKNLDARRGKIPSFFPSNYQNLCICCSGIGVTKKFSCIICDQIPDLELIGKSQCFPLYWYQKTDETEGSSGDLFSKISGSQYIRRDGITDWILNQAKERYHMSHIRKEDIFYYVYGFLHSNDYRIRFSAELKKSLPKISLVDSYDYFKAFSGAGRKLANLHLGFENQKPLPEVEVDTNKGSNEGRDPYVYYRVDPKMTFASAGKKKDRSIIVYNSNITIRNIPEKAYEYVVNGKSAIEWVMERYAVKTDKDSLIKNDANDMSRERNDPKYILSVLLGVIAVSVKTVDIVNSLPKLRFDDEDVKETR